MNPSKVMPLLLIEDDAVECIRFKESISKRTDATFIGITNSSFDGITYVKNRMPEAIILDLELNKGKGSGMQFLEALNDMKLRPRPIVVVTTNIATNLVYNHVHTSGVDMVFYKKQDGYSYDMVINSILTLRKSLHTVKENDNPYDLKSVETPEQLQLRISERIDAELDMLGMSTRYRGRRFFHEAILTLLNEDEDYPESIIVHLTIKHKQAYSSIARAMQTSINKAWELSSVEDLQMYYTARVDHRSGVPTPTELIYYYVNKIRKSM